MESFKQYNDQLNIKDVADWLRLPVKKGFVVCPFHSEKTASMKLYEHSFYCFGCNKSGDSISLTAEVLGVTQFEALQELNRTFNLGLIRQNHTKVIHNTKPKKNLYEIWYRKALKIMTDYMLLCSDGLRYFDEKCWINKSIKHLEKYELIQDEMFTMQPKEAFETYRREVEIVDAKLRRRAELEQNFKCN